MPHPLRLLLCSALCLVLAGRSGALADVKLPAIFGDHMVLQQNLPVPVWGTANPGEAVTVQFAGRSASAKADLNGKWSLKLPPLTPDSRPGAMTVTGNNQVTFSDVLVGEVWVCSGQSNMEFPLKYAHNAKEELPKAAAARIRLFHVKKATAHFPAADVEAQWQVCSPESARDISAVGYFFARELCASLNRPVGLVEADWGGTPAQAWTSLEGLRQSPELASYVAQWNHADAVYQKNVTNRPAAQAAYDAAMKEWTAKYGETFDAAMKAWSVELRKAAAVNQPLPKKPVPAVPAPTPSADPSGGEKSPATLYNGMIAPLQPFAIRGTIWYQGEANAGAWNEYRTLFPQMIKDWRRAWGEGDFPFLWVQLAGYGPGGEAWCKLREAQRETLSLPKTGMASAVDIGLPYNIHPTNKITVGHRLALAARCIAYGERLEWGGPALQSVTREPAGLRVTFRNTGGRLKIGTPPWVPPGTQAPPADRLVSFEALYGDGKWKPAEAKIDGNSVIVSAGADATGIRYGWKSYSDGNLYNQDELPALPFQRALR